MQEQYLAYNLDSLIADFGGYLGLLLGQSILSFYDLGLGFLNKFGCGKQAKTKNSVSKIGMDD